jgi:predicted RNA binding protein YcfA (HicA-like mRNA interferase family)
MGIIETNTRKVIARLEREGWTNIGGGAHDRFTNPAAPSVMIAVPRHRALSPGVARSIAKSAGWI